MTTLHTLLEIHVFDGTKEIVHGVFDQQKILIGRMNSADFRISDPRVSRIHALLERLDDGTLRLTDLASSRGTFVNGERIVERIVGAKDEIVLADLKLKLKAVAISPSTDTLPPAVPSTSSTKDLAHMTPDGGVQISREPTQIRSLKETARTRGVLDVIPGAREDLEITVYWHDTVLAVDHYRKDAQITLGEDTPRATYLVPQVGLTLPYTFVSISRSRVTLNMDAHMKGSVRLQGQMHTIEELMKAGKTSVDLSVQDIAKIQVGTVHFFLMFVPEPPAIPKAPIFDQGPLFWGSQLLMTLLALSFIAVGILFKDPIEGKVTELPEKYRRIIVQEYQKRKIMEEQPQVQALKPEVPVTPTDKVAKVSDKPMPTQRQQVKGGNEGEGARRKGPEGKRGTPNAQKEAGVFQPRKSGDPSKPVVKKDQPTLLSALKNSGLGAKLGSAVTGGATNGNSVGGGLDKALSGVGGTTMEDGRGVGGAGTQGTGKGGGGSSEGVGGLGTKGDGFGAKGSGFGALPGTGGPAAIGVEGGDMEILGGLTREQIERVIREHQNELRFCHQRALEKDPSVFGKIALKWIISQDGRVGMVSVLDNGTGNKTFADCIVDRLRTWRFPSNPVAKTEVDKPFLFKSN